MSTQPTTNRAATGRPQYRRRLIAVLAAGLLTAGGLAGCSGKAEPGPASGPIEPLELNSFARAWSADLDLTGGKPITNRREREAADQLTELHLRDDAVYAYTRDGKAISINRPDGNLQWAADVKGGERGHMRAPVVEKDSVVFLTEQTLEVYDKFGRLQRSVPLNFAVASNPAQGKGNIVYVGGNFSGNVKGDLGGSARLVKLDVSQAYHPAVWELMVPRGGVAGAPAAVGDAVYVGAGDGSVYAVSSQNREPIWATPDGVFKTGGPIFGDTAADETAVYVASTDTKLYALNRNSGRIVWQYLAGVPLRSGPVVTADTVYQLVPGAGLAALNKNEAGLYRRPRWLLTGARQFLSSDDRYAYVLGADNRIAAVDKNTGEIKFQSRRNDLDVFATNTKADGIIYAGTRTGRVLAIRPVLKPGGMGEVVMAPATPFAPRSEVALAR